ncbi:MAG: tRNA uridine-5-carboxymethylaminomethyl(34) synthesis GTPase MnmE [Nitrospinota bacterium]
MPRDIGPSPASPARPDTIAAIATPPGEGAIGIVRVSGPEAARLAGRVFRSRGGKPVRELIPRALHHGRVTDPDTGETLDECLLAVMPAPNSYTGEDVVEIHAHGGPVSLRAILGLLVDLGARPAEPGEFTRRAFLNGRMDLLQAEAVADLIAARSEAGRRAALGHLSGRLSRELEEVWGVLIGVSAQLEAAIDFPDEDIEVQGADRLAERAEGARARLVSLLDSFRVGRAVREGTPVAIVGRPNVGKSSLLNLLLREDRALTSPYPGTTRDTIEETAVIGGLPFRFIDTAGLREPEHPVEWAGIERARRMVESASMALAVLDASAPLEGADREIVRELEGLVVIGVLNKSDLAPAIDPEEAEALFGGNRTVRVSALRGDGLEELESVMVEAALGGGSASEELVLTRERHRERVKAAADAVGAGVESLRAGRSPELTAVDFSEAMDALAGLLGKTFTEDLLDSIFSEFCIGK